MKFSPERNKKISETLKRKYANGLPPHQLDALREAHNRPEVRERHRQATLRQLADITDRAPMHTPIEIRLSEGMRDAGLSFATQQRLLDRYVVDFLMIGKPLVVEADGLHHKLPKSKARDAQRDIDLNASGYTVLRFPGSQIMRFTQDCVNRIIEALDALDGEEPSSQVIIIGNQEGENNPMWGKPAWNKGLTADTDERQKRSSDKWQEAMRANGSWDSTRARWDEYRGKFDWEKMKRDYAELRSVNAVAKIHGVGKRQLREYLQREGIVLDGHLHNKGRSGRPRKIAQDIV